MRGDCIYPQLQICMYLRHMDSKELSKAAEINYTSLRRKLRGETTFSLNEAIRIKKGLCTDVPLEKLFATGEGIEP